MPVKTWRCVRGAPICVAYMSNLSDARTLRSTRKMRLISKGLSLTSWTHEVYLPPITHYSGLISTTTSAQYVEREYPSGRL